MTKELRLALLIDADNAAAGALDNIMREIASLGRMGVRRAYGNWTTPQMGGWKGQLLSHSIQPIQQFSYTTGKNATDSALIIDAMDLLYTRRFDAFCLISSDSDFTRLAQRIREEGLLVYGFGNKNTPKAFMQACDRFTYLEVLERSDDSLDFYDSADMVFSSNHLKPIDAAVELVRRAIDSLADSAGFANIGAIKNHVLKVEPDFDTRLFGHAKFSDFLRAYPRYFVLEDRSLPNGHKVSMVKMALR